MNVDLFLHGFEKRRFGHEGLLRRAAKIVSAACTEDRPGRHQYRRVFACIVIVYEADDKKSKVVEAVDAQAMLSAVGENRAMSEVAREVNEGLGRAIEQI